MRRYTYIALAMVAVTALLTYSIMIWDQPAPKVENQPEKPKDSLSGLTLDPVSQLNSRIQPDRRNSVTKLILQRYFTYCDHTATEEVKQDSPLLDLPQDELLKLYSDWELKENAGGRIVLYHSVDDLCPADLAKQWVGEKNGYVAIFYGEPGMREKLFRLTDIPVKNFPLQIKANLAHGIPSESEDHLITIIEGLQVYLAE